MARLTSLLVVLWVGVTVGSVVDLQKRIVGGEACPKDERGYHAFITFNDGNDDFICGGSLIHKQWILTAAHCWKAGRTVTAVFGRNPLSKPPVEIEPTPWTFEDKDDEGNTRQHDIMLLKLLKPATEIKPVPLPDCANKPKEGETVQIAGYYSKIQPGDEDGPGQIDYSKPLQCADIKVVNCDEFTKYLQASHPKMYHHLLCFQHKKGKVDITGGDSGAGLVFKDMIYGVIVTGHKYAGTGAAASIDLCEDIYKEWISETIAANSGG